MDLNKVYPSIGDRYERHLNEEDALLAVIISIIVDRIASSGVVKLYIKQKVFALTEDFTVA